jgi:glycine betaine/proline transport system ATP-binding protein
VNEARTAPGDDAEIVVEVRELWKIFGDNPRRILDSEELRVAPKDYLLEETGCVVAVRDISFKVRRGEVFVIMGLSGSGKSTLIRCVLRLIEPTSGQVFMEGQDISRLNAEQLIEVRRHTTGMIFQHFGLFPHRTVLENAAYGLKVRSVGREERLQKAHQALERVGLKGWDDYFPGALSGGMQQRVGIARALANDPDIILMDEPFSGLDPLIRRQMQDELINLQSELRKTILFVTHDLDEALKLGDHIAIMKDGEIVQVGVPEDVITSPSDDYVRSFVQDASAAKVVKAGSIMEEPRARVYSWQGPKAAMAVLRRNHIDNAFVVDRNNVLQGIVTLNGLIDMIRNNRENLADTLDKDVITCDADTLMEELFALAASSPYPIAVVDEDRKLIGEVFDQSIFIGLVQEKAETETEAEAPPPDAQAEPLKGDA